MHVYELHLWYLIKQKSIALPNLQRKLAVARIVYISTHCKRFVCTAGLQAIDALVTLWLWPFVLFRAGLDCKGHAQICFVCVTFNSIL